MNTPLRHAGRSLLPLNLLVVLLVVLLNLLSAPAAAQQQPVFTTHNGAIRGYDPVAYYTLGRPVKGNMEFSVDYQGASWYFSSEKHRELFADDPQKFAPAYGGYCAYGLTKGHLVPVDPHAWTIHDGRLYLNYSLGVRSTWQSDVPGHLQQSDANWIEHNR